MDPNTFDDALLLPGERVDEIGFSDLKLIQKPSAFCYGIDAVLAADYVKVRSGGRICDLGTGTGIIPLILSHKTRAREIWGVEVQQESYSRACRSLRINSLEGRVRFLHSDVLQVNGYFEPESFDTVVSNPPYMERDGGLKNSQEEKTIARHETTANLEDFLKAASYLLKEKGDLYMVHRPSRLVDLCFLGRSFRLEPKKIRFVFPNEKAKPNILLVHFVKGGNPELKFEDPLYVYDGNRQYTDEILRIYERI